MPDVDISLKKGQWLKRSSIQFVVLTFFENGHVSLQRWISLEDVWTRMCDRKTLNHRVDILRKAQSTMVSVTLLVPVASPAPAWKREKRKEDINVGWPSEDRCVNTIKLTNGDRWGSRAINHGSTQGRNQP